MTDMTLLNRAGALGAEMADAYREEFGVHPGEDGPDGVGDWDSTAWGESWKQLEAEGATDRDHDDCWREWQFRFGKNQ